MMCRDDDVSSRGVRMTSSLVAGIVVTDTPWSVATRYSSGRPKKSPSTGT